MGASRNPPPSRAGPSAPRRSGKGAARAPNRAQLRAMEARAAAVPPAPVADDEDEIVVEAIEREARPRRGSARPADRARGRARGVVARPVALSREEEYRYIRGDLNRLLVTAGALLVLMMVLLVVVE